LDQLRLTTLTLSCSAGEGQVCDPIDKVFQANGGTTDPNRAFNMPLTNAYFTGSASDGGTAAFALPMPGTSVRPTPSEPPSATAWRSRMSRPNRAAFCWT